MHEKLVAFHYKNEKRLSIRLISASKFVVLAINSGWAGSGRLLLQVWFTEWVAVGAAAFPGAGGGVIFLLYCKWSGESVQVDPGGCPACGRGLAPCYPEG